MSTTESVIGKITKITIAKGIVKLEITSTKDHYPDDISQWDSLWAIVHADEDANRLPDKPMTPIEEEADRGAREAAEAAARGQYAGMNIVENQDPAPDPAVCRGDACEHFNIAEFSCIKYGEPGIALERNEALNFIKCVQCFQEEHPNVTALEGLPEEVTIDNVLEYRQLCRACVVKGNVKAHSFIDLGGGTCEECGAEGVDLYRVKKQPAAPLDAQDPIHLCKLTNCENFRAPNKELGDADVAPECHWPNAMGGDACDVIVLEADAEGNLLKHQACLLTYQSAAIGPGNEGEVVDVEFVETPPDDCRKCSDLAEEDMEYRCRKYGVEVTVDEFEDLTRLVPCEPCLADRQGQAPPSEPEKEEETASVLVVGASRVNKNGVLIDVENIEVPFPKSAKAKVRVMIAFGPDGLWRFGVDSEWLGKGRGGAGFAPSMNASGEVRQLTDTREAAVVEALKHARKYFEEGGKDAPKSLFACLDEQIEKWQKEATSPLIKPAIGSSADNISGKVQTRKQKGDCPVRGCHEPATVWHCKSCDVKVCAAHQEPTGHGNHGHIVGPVNIIENRAWERVNGSEGEVSE